MPERQPYLVTVKPSLANTEHGLGVSYGQLGDDGLIRVDVFTGDSRKLIKARPEQVSDPIAPAQTHPRTPAEVYQQERRR